MLRVVIDFDDTLVRHDVDNEPAPVPEAREALLQLKQRGFWITISTCRIGLAIQNNTLQEELDYVKGLLNQFKIPFDDIHLGEKPVADIYIDDRAVRFAGDWLETVQDVERIVDGKRWRRGS